jgi:two-component system cell cycle sensor histidine kinase/response regulator CckA
MQAEPQNEELRQTRADLEAAQARAFDLYDLAPVGYCTLSEPGLIVEANLTAATLLGTAPRALIAQPITRFILHEDQGVYNLHRTRLFETRELQACDVRMLKLDGTVFWAQLTATAAQGPGGEPVCHVVLIDITRRRRTEELLRQERELYFDLVNSQPAGIYRLRVFPRAQWRKDAWIGSEDPPFILELVNDRFCELLGISRQILETNPGIISDLVATEDKAEFARKNEEANARLIPFQWEGRLLIGGKTIWAHFESLPRPVENGEILWTGFLYDISEARRADEALRESEARYRSLVEGTPGIVYSYSNQRGGLYYSSRVADLLGYLPEQLYAQPMLWRHSIHPDDLGRVEQRILRAASGNAFSIEYRIRDAQGHWHWFDDRSTECKREGAEVIIEGYALDITARKMAEEENAKLEALLQQAQKMESVGRLAGGVAHDFNNMLGVILGYAELALGQVDPAQPLHADIEEIHKAACRSADLTRQLLAFARKQAVAPKVLDLNDTVAAILKMLHRLVGEDIDLAWQPGADLWPVNVDPSQIDQILANLCVNGRESISGVGTLTITTKNCTIDESYCATHAECVPGEYVLLAVGDDGCGMAVETVARIFEPFFTTKAVGRGTGLGLSTVYGIVKQNNGIIDVLTQPNQGTTFRIYLPRHLGKPGQARTEGVPGPVPRGHETILLVEDEPAILVLTKRMLEKHGYTVLTASSPGEALRLAREHVGEIHLLMTDVIMPEMNGRVLARNLLSLYPHVKRLYMSGYTADVIAHRGVLDEGVHFIQKPFSAEELATVVRDALEALN